jgi:hypothetical protein
LKRLSLPARDAPVACLLDTGVNNGHPLLEPLLPASNMFAYLGTWGKADHHGHGTQMAGLAGYGELTSALSATGIVRAEHALESVKSCHRSARTLLICTAPSPWTRVRSPN